MTFIPILPYSGSDGWGYLRDTLDSQQDRYEAALPPALAADRAAFAARIGGATSVEAFLQDETLKRVALTAFGLGSRKPTTAFLRTVLTTPTTGPQAAGAFDDPRWFELARAFGYGDTTPRVTEPGFADEILARHRLQGFEEAVGRASPAMRRALAFDRSLRSLAAGGFDEAGGWRQVLADDNARSVFKAAFNLGPGFDAAPLDEQVRQLRAAAETVTGSRRIDAFADETLRDAVLDRFFSAAAGGTLAGLGFVRPQTGRGGVAGWSLLRGSLDNQQAGFARATAREPALRHFETRVASATTAAAFVADERLVDVALTAFGLGRMRPTAAFLQQVLESDPADPKSFAAQQNDPRWAEMARVFGYGDGGGARVADFGFAEDMIARWRIGAFEEAVGAQDGDLRLALIADRTLKTIASAGFDADTGWQRVLANPAMALVMGRAMGLGDDFMTRPLAEQVAQARAEARRLTGSDGVEGFGRDITRDTLIRRFLANPPGAERVRGVSQPVLPLDGVPGWAFLKRTLPDQQARFAASAQVQREIAYFRDTIGSVTSAADLVRDRRLLGVALEAFGLAEEIDKRAFVQKALAEGTEDPGAMAARMVDTRYRDLAAAFGFGNAAGAQTGVDGFAETIIARYTVRAFESAVGEQDESLRLALNFDRTMARLAGQEMSADAGWFRVLGDVPLRRVVEGALGLPSQFSQLDIDRQVAVVRERARRSLGSDGLSAFGDKANREDMIRRFLVRESIAQSGFAGGSGSVALQMLQAMPRGGLNRLL